MLSVSSRASNGHLSHSNFRIQKPNLFFLFFFFFFSPESLQQPPTPPPNPRSLHFAWPPSIPISLLQAYPNLSLLHLSLQLFHSLHCPDALSYHPIIQALTSHHYPAKALFFFHQMLSKSFPPDGPTCSRALRACADLSTPACGEQIHGQLIKLDSQPNSRPVKLALIEMYAECGDIDSARMVFGEMPARDLGSWNAFISGSCRRGDPLGSFRLFKRMRRDGVEPNSNTLISLLQSSVNLECLEAGRFIHLLSTVSGFRGILALDTATLTMYLTLGRLDTAALVFQNMAERDCAVWNILITAYSRDGYPEKALEMVNSMTKLGVRTDLFTAIAAISSAAELKSLEIGREIHAHTIRNGSNYQSSVHNALIKMYAECGRAHIARKVFDSLMNKTIVSWSAMIKGYAAHSSIDDALALFHQMSLEGLRFDSATLINIMPVLVNFGALEQIKTIHGYSIKEGLAAPCSALLVSYAKCGCIENAQKLFDEEEVEVKDVFSWNSMINAYAKHGDWHHCFKLYHQMQGSNIRPDQITFIGLLTACVNSGLVKEGWEYFNQMTERYGCERNQEHYACMVNLLGRTGHIDEAANLIKQMPFKPDARVWGPLLTACKLHSETRLAEFAAEKLIEIEPKNAGNYVLLSNIYAAAGKWDGVAKMRGVLRDRGLKKTPGCSWLEISGRVHEFHVADRLHPNSEEIYSILRNLELEIKADACTDSKLLS